MKIILFTILACFGVNAVADDHISDVKTANPFIEMHPKAVQPAADAYYKAVEAVSYTHLTLPTTPYV